MTNSSWRVGSWTTPTTTVSQPPVPSEVSPESRSKISTNIFGQFPSFIREQYPTFIDFVREYYKSQELKGYCFDIIQNWSDYYNIDNYGDLVTTTTLISTVTTSSTAIDVESTRDFPNEGLLMIDDEIIYYQKKGSTLFQDCARGFNAVKSVGIEGDYKFESTTSAEHALGAEVVNLNNIFPLYMLGKFKEQFLNTFPKNFANGVTESTIIKRIKDFYASKGTGRSFQFVLRSLFGVESQVSYPRERIFKPSDAFYTSREIIRAVPVSGDPIELVGQVLYQDADPNDPNVDSARIYVKGVVEVFTANGSVYEIDVDTNNSFGTFVTPYKTVLSQDLGANLTDTVVTVDSTLGWPETNGKFRIEDEIISYTDKTVTQFIGCNRARENTSNVAHDAGQEVFAAFKIYGNSNIDGSEIQLKIFGGTRGVVLNSGGKYYLPDSKVTTPAAPGFDSIDPIWDSFIYNVRRALRGVSATLAAPATDGSVRCTIVTKEKHRLTRDDSVRILNAPEDLYNNSHTVVGIVDEFTFEFIFTTSPAFGISGFEFYIAKEFAFGKSDDNSINLSIKDTTGDVQNTYRSTDHAIVASTGIPTHKIGPFGSGDLDPGNQRYLKRIPLAPIIKSEKTATPIGQIAIGSNGVPLFSYKSETKKIYGGIKTIERINGGSGYDITNPPTVEFEPEYKLDTTYASGLRVTWNGNRYRSLNAGKSSATVYPVHTIGVNTVGTIDWEYEGTTATAGVVITGSVTSINVTNGGSGYITQPIVSIVGGGATSGSQAFATAQITAGTVTGITIVNGGSGYTSVPTISISGGGGTGATAVAVCRGPVDSINIVNAGSQYTYEPTINLISGSGAVAYPSILNGKIESIIVTFGGSAYFGPPDVIITGDGVGATAFATVDLSSNIVTSITVSSKGIGYTAGNTQVSIVYPGSGAQFQTRLTELSINEAATGAELGSNTFVSPKTSDPYGGVSFRGENFLIYSGEYGYLYNPKQLRFLLKDSIGLDNNGDLQELPPTVHSPIIGWAYDGHPVYGPYGYEDPENSAPFNAYKRIRSSYRVKTSRDALLSGLSDPLGTYIEDYEYVEGLGDLDRYNGRYCVTPEYPDGVYCYFTTITGTTGDPAFPYFIGENFYGEADPVNWNGNGLQRNFTEDAVRYRAPFLGVDNIVAKRKELDNKVDFFLALEDSTTLIVMETGETLTYIEDGIGYYSYYPFIRGGTADSLVVSSTNKFSSAGINEYLVEGGGKDYKVNDRLIFDNTGTGGDGVSAVVSQVEGVPTVSVSAFTGTYNDLFVNILRTSETNFLQPGDTITVSVTDNSATRSLTTKVINGNYHFKYFNLTSAKLLDPWQATTSYVVGDLVYVGNRVYVAAPVINSEVNTSGSSAPTHTSGTVSDGGANWTFKRTRTDGNLFQDGWSSITGGSNYLNGTYINVPLTSSGDGLGAKATIVISGNAVTTVTITDFGYGYDVGDTISADNVNLGNAVSGAGFSITLTQVQREVQFQTNKAHQLKEGDLVNVSGVSPVSYNKANYIVVRTETARKFTVKRNFASTSAANVTTGNSGNPADVYIKEPNLSLIDGHSYIFDTSDASNSGKVLNFTLDPSNTDILTYKNVIDEVRDVITNEQNSITLKMLDLPGVFYYHDVKHTNVSPRTFTVNVAAKTTAHPLYGYGSGNGYYITGDKYGSSTESPAITMSRGLTYTFNQNSASNSTHAIYFSESEDAYGGTLRYEKGVVYRINGDVVSWSDYNTNFNTASTRSVEITPTVDTPNTLHYVCQNHLAMGNAINIKSDVTNSRYLNVINDPILGTHTIDSVDANNKEVNFYSALQPESGYNVGVSYSTNSIYPSGGIAKITIGDQGRNYMSLPKLSGSARSGSGATATATISGGLANVSVTNNGSGYNQASLPTTVVTMPDFVDLTLENVLGNFLPDEIIIGKAIQDNNTARGKVIAWNPITSVLRLQPLRNTRTGAGQKGYIMFNAGKVYNINPSQIDAVGYADQFEFAVHDAQTGDPVKYVSAQTNPISNLTVGQTYYIINIGDAGRVKLAETPQLAEVGTAITITNSGTGTQSFNVRSRVYTGGNSVATIGSISGTQATVAAAVSGAGRVSEVTVTGAGTNYRAAPDVIFDDPYYGVISSISIQSQSATNYGASQTYTGIIQKSIAGSSATGATFTISTNGAGTIESVTVTAGGTAYVLGDQLTISGADLGGSDGTHDAVLVVQEGQLSFVDPVSTESLLDASIDSVTVTNSGSGYLSAPTVTAQGGNGINAALNALIINEGVSVINIEAAGQQFQSAPIINIEQKVGTGASILLKSSDMGEILKIGGDNITFNYSHDRTLKPKLNTTYNLQLIRTQIIDYLDVVNGGSNFVATPEILLEGGQGSLFDLEPIVLNEIIQSVEVNNAGRGFTSAPTVKAQVSHTFVALSSNSTLNFPYNAKIPSGTAITLVASSGQFPAPLTENTTYYAIAATLANGLASNQIKLATSLANANTETSITFTSSPIGDPLTGQTFFILRTTDLGDNIIAYMKPATFAIGERIYQGASTSSYTAYGIIKNWDASGRVVSVELIEGDFVVGQPVFGEESAAFGQIHAFDRADAEFVVSPISTSAANWEKTTGFLDLNEQRVYDSNRFQEFSYDISSSVNISDWKNPLKFAAHPAGFKVVGTQVLLSSVKKEFRPRSTNNTTPSSQFDWWLPNTNTIGNTFNGTTFITPKPSAKNAGKLATINNFALSRPDYSALVPTEVSIYGKQLLDVQKILSCIAYKLDDISDRTLSFDGSSSTIVDGTNDRITITNHGLVADQLVTYFSGGDRFLDARDLIVNNIDYIVEETIGFLNVQYPTLTYDQAKCARDTRLVIAAWTNDLKYGGNFFSVDAAKTYTTGTGIQHVGGEEAETIFAFNKARDLCLLAVTNDLPVGTYTNIVPQTDLSITNDAGGCADVKSAITTLAGIVTNVISNPSAALPTQDIGNYPNNRSGIPIGGLTNGSQYYVRYVDANTIELSSTLGGNKIDLTSQGSGVGHSLRCFIDGTNDSFRLRVNGVDLDTQLGKTAATSQLLLSVNGLIANPATYTLSNSIVTFAIPPLSNTKVIAMYYDRASYSGSFVLDQIGDEVKTFGTGYSGLGVHTFVSGVTNAIQVTGGSQFTAASGTTYDPTTGLLVIEIGSHSLTTSNTITIADGGITFTCDADNHASNHAYPRSGDPASGKQLAITAVTGSTITVNVGISNDEPNELAGGTGYSDGVYSAVPLKNRLGSGVGATADITVTNGSVTNVKLVSGGNGYNNTDVLGIADPRVGEQLVKHFVPTSATYAPTSGEMVLTVGAGHGLSAPTTHTPTGATYDPNTGLMVVTIANHGRVNGDQVKFADGAIRFSCTYGGGGNGDYPRSTDYASDRWLQVFDCTTNTFTVQVLDSIPSTDLSPHTFVSAVNNSVKFAVSTVRIANKSLTFSCAFGGTPATYGYPRPTDPIGTQGKMKDVPVEAVASTTITVNALNGTSPTNTDAHTWQGVATYQFQPTGIAYTPSTGEMVVTVNGHDMIKGDRIQFATNSLTFTCAKDNHSTQHTYPRVGDPAEGAWHTIDAVTTNTFTVFVGESSDTSTHTFVSATSTAVTRAVVSYGVYKYSKGADAGSLLRVNQEFIATTAYGRMQADNPSFSGIYKTKCIRDTKLLIDAVADNVEFGGNDATYDAANFYVGTVHLSGEEGQSVQVFNHARDICRQVMRNLTVTTNSDTVGTQITDNTISVDNGTSTYSETCCIDVASTITSLWGIVTQAVGTGAHTYVGGTASNAVQSGGNYVHTFVSAVPNGVTSNVGNLPNPVTGVAYTPNTGNMVITSNAHNLTTSNTLTIADNALSFTCTMDGNTATKTYPRSTDPVSGQTIAITNTTTNTITVNVGASPIVNHDVTDATYDNNTGVLVLTIGSHTLTAGTSIKIANGSLDFTCENDNNTSTKSYPRPSDPYYDTAINIDSVTSTTITLNVGTNNGNLVGITRTQSSSPYFQIGVSDVTFDGNDTVFTTLSGGSTQVLPASDNFLIFLNSTLQIKGSTDAYTYAGSEITFTEPPIAGMDFYGFYFGKLTQLDAIEPFFDNKKKTFTMTQNTEPFSLESDNAAVQAQNNLLIFLNGVYQEPGVAYSLTGSIIEFSEPPRAGSDCVLFIYTGSSSDVLISNTFQSIDPGDRVQIDSEGTDRLVATVSSSTTIDSYEFTGLRPSVAEFTATITGGAVTQVTITDQGSNYEVPPILLFQGGGGSGATAETTIETGSGRVLSVINLKGGAGYTSAPTVLAVHPLALERKQRDRILSNSNILGTSYLTATISAAATTLNLKNVYFNSTQKNGFPDEGEVLVPFYNATESVWCCERILYASKDTSANTLTVATGGRGFSGTTASIHTVLNGTYTVAAGATLCAVTTSANHNFTTGQRIVLDFEIGSGSGTAPNGTYTVTVTGSTTFTVELPFAITAGTSGNTSVCPEVRLRSL